VAGDAVSGIIDWGDAALSDPAYDLGLLYRDCGHHVLQSTIDSYLLHRDASREALTERAIFHGKCASFEDIEFGMRYQRKEYSDKGLQTLTWIFSA
jgi:aminoglycoside phosphotransferase (APT) family kinase protein